MLGKFSAVDILKYCSYSSWKTGLGFHAICMKCQNLFLGNKRTNINLSSAEYVKEVVHCFSYHQDYTSHNAKVTSHNSKVTSHNSKLKSHYSQVKMSPIGFHTKAIRKTCLYNVDPLKPHFYMVKLGF